MAKYTVMQDSSGPMECNTLDEVIYMMRQLFRDYGAEKVTICKVQ